MAETEFHKIADKTLNHLCEMLESADNEGLIDIDLLNGILNIELPDSRQYVINKHEPSKQIWMSSPVSGAKHFSYDENTRKWVSSSQDVLEDVVSSEISRLTGAKLG